MTDSCVRYRHISRICWLSMKATYFTMDHIVHLDFKLLFRVHSSKFGNSVSIELINLLFYINRDQTVRN